MQTSLSTHSPGGVNQLIGSPTSWISILHSQRTLHWSPSAGDAGCGRFLRGWGMGCDRAGQGNVGQGRAQGRTPEAAGLVHTMQLKSGSGEEFRQQNRALQHRTCPTELAQAQGLSAWEAATPRVFPWHDPPCKHVVGKATSWQLRVCLSCSMPADGDQDD